jgi:NAD(P)-dependent dehydrogenase (short-subunit alcohol dehydrogenase family)
MPLVDDIRKQGGEALFLTTDVMNRATLEQNLTDVLARYGRVDVLLNAAGGNMPGATIAPDKTIFDLNADDFKSVMDLNLIGTLLPTQVFLKPMARAEARRRGQLLVDVGLPTAHPRGGIWRGQGRREQFHRLHGHGGRQQVQSRHPRERHCAGLLPDRPEPLAAHYAPTARGRSAAATSSTRRRWGAWASPKSSAAPSTTSSATPRGLSPARWPWSTEVSTCSLFNRHEQDHDSL